MPIHIDIETDTLYIRGTEKGMEKGVEKERRQNVLNLWRNNIDPSMISNLLNLSIEQIEDIIAEWQKQNPKKA
jgi:hypothetical protein